MVQAVRSRRHEGREAGDVEYGEGVRGPDGSRVIAGDDEEAELQDGTRLADEAHLNGQVASVTVVVDVSDVEHQRSRRLGQFHRAHVVAAGGDRGQHCPQADGSPYRALHAHLLLPPELKWSDGKGYDGRGRFLPAMGQAARSRDERWYRPLRGATPRP